MATVSTKPKATSASATAVRAPKIDAITLLKADHADVKKCFKSYDKIVKKDPRSPERQALANEICKMLSVHAQIEEEIFYPAAREVLGSETDLVDEADVEHASAKDLISQIENSDPDDLHYNARVKVLAEYIDHHVQEEQEELFPAVKAAGMDTKGIGSQLAARKAELMGSAKAK